MAGRRSIDQYRAPKPEQAEQHRISDTKAWVGVDLDGTLAYFDYDQWYRTGGIGAPIEPMVNLVKQMLSQGTKVKIFTARIAVPDHTDRIRILCDIRDWCVKHIGTVLPITNEKDMNMIELYDDRAYRVGFNTGQLISDQPLGAQPLGTQPHRCGTCGSQECSGRDEECEDFAVLSALDDGEDILSPGLA